MAAAELHTFGELTLEVPERRLSRRGQDVVLSPKAYDVLVHLVRHAGRLVTKRELLDAIWSEAFVEEGIVAVHVSGLRKALGDDPRRPRYIQTVSRAGYRFVAAVTTTAPAEPSIPTTTVAVLPATPEGAMPSGADRSTGLALADAIIDRLGRFRQIAVRPTRAVRAYAAPRTSVPAVGRALEVDVVLDSSFHWNVGCLCVSARLVRAGDGTILWSGAFDQPTTGLSVSEAIAISVVAHLGVPAPVAGVVANRTSTAPRGVARPPARPEVYELIGRGRSHLLSAARTEVPSAIAAFAAAVEMDATYAPAHAGLALSYCAEAEARVAPHAEAYARARDAALRALAMDDGCADAQVALGAVLFMSDWNWIGAERALQRALEINPNHTEAYVLYGRLLDALGRLDDGLAMKLRALARDPSSPFVHLAIALSHWNQRRYHESIRWATKTLDLDSTHLLAREFLAGAYWKMGDFDRHMAENVKHAESYGVPAEALEPMKRAYAADGRTGVVRLALERAVAQPTGFPDFQLALFHGELGDLDAALASLDRALDSRDPCLVDLAVAPQWDLLRSDPRFHERVVRMGLAHAAGTPPPVPPPA